MWSIRVGLLMFALSATVAEACREPFPTEFTPETYATPLLALRGLADGFTDEGPNHDVEYAGALVLDVEGSVRATIGSGCPHRDNVVFRVAVRRGQTILAFWHTHGAHGHLRRLFSEADAEVVRHFGVPFYLFTADGELRVLSPYNLARTRVNRVRYSAVRFRGYVGEKAVSGLIAER